MGQLIAYHAQEDAKKEVVGFFNDFELQGTKVNDIPVLGGGGNVLQLYKEGIFDCLMIGVGYQHFEYRKKTFERFKGIIPFANIIHSSAYIDPSCQLGEGIFILPGCCLDRQVQLEDNVLLNTACSIAHDTRVGAHSFLSPRVALAGFVKIGQCCNIGINTTIIDNITITDGVQTGGGSVVNKSIEQKGLYVGVPARFIR